MNYFSSKIKNLIGAEIKNTQTKIVREKFLLHQIQQHKTKQSDFFTNKVPYVHAQIIKSNINVYQT